MNAYFLSILPNNRNDVSITIVCDNAVSSHPYCTNTTSSEWVHVEQSLQLPARRRMKKRTTSGCSDNKNNNKKHNIEKNTNNKSRHLIRDSYSEKDVLEALQECMNIVNNGNREFVSIPTKQPKQTTRERLDKRYSHENRTRLFSFDGGNTAPKHIKLPPQSIRSTSSASIKVVIPHIQHQKKDNLKKKSSIIPPKIPRRRSSLLLLVKPSSSSLLNINGSKHITPSDQQNAS